MVDFYTQKTIVLGPVTCQASIWFMLFELANSIRTEKLLSLTSQLVSQVSFQNYKKQQWRKGGKKKKALFFSLLGENPYIPSNIYWQWKNKNPSVTWCLWNESHIQGQYKLTMQWHSRAEIIKTLDDGSALE